MANEKFILYRDDKPFVEIREEGYERDPNHKYVIYGDKPPVGFISQAAEILTKSYFDAVLKQPLKKWKKDRQTYSINWSHLKSGAPMKSENLNYLIIAEELRTFGKFDCDKFKIQPIGCLWLDTSLDISQNYHFFEQGNENALFMNDGVPKQQYGEDYPIKPKLDREGHIFTTFQPALIKRVIRQRKSLIENSDKALFTDWIMDLRSLINDCVSLVDINLNQLYNKAQYAPESDWSFDKEVIGEKNNRRIIDKLKWVRQITGRPFDIEKEFKSFNNLRKLRNHLNHFDPPTLVITIEEATAWLNDVLNIGQILIKLRQAIDVPISLLLIELICQKEAKFNPEAAFKKRLPITDSGYITSTWPDSDEDE
jgi:hypothetical protein